VLPARCTPCQPPPLPSSHPQQQRSTPQGSAGTFQGTAGQDGAGHCILKLSVALYSAVHS
jgi:hypothetical protein